MINKNSLGCGKKIKIINNKEVRTNKDLDFICGVANGWGYEKLCLKCKLKLKEKWSLKN